MDFDILWLRLMNILNNRFCNFYLGKHICSWEWLHFGMSIFVMSFPHFKQTLHNFRDIFAHFKAFTVEVKMNWKNLSLTRKWKILLKGMLNFHNTVHRTWNGSYLWFIHYCICLYHVYLEIVLFGVKMIAAYVWNLHQIEKLFIWNIISSDDKKCVWQLCRK